MPTHTVNGSAQMVPCLAAGEGAMGMVGDMRAVRAVGVVGAMGAMGVVRIVDGAAGVVITIGAMGAEDGEAGDVERAMGVVTVVEGAVEAVGTAEAGETGDVVGAMGAVTVAGVREVVSGVEAFGFAAATEAAGVMEAGEVVGVVVVITAAGARNSNIAKASAAVIFEVIQVLRERTRLNWVHAELGDRFLPEPLGKYTQQHLGPLVLAHHSALGDYSADVIVGAEKRLETLRIVVIVGAEKRLETLRIVVSAPKCPTELFQILTCVYKGIRPAIGIPKRIQHLLLECSPISALITAHNYHLLAHIQALFCFLFYSFCIHSD